MTWFKLRLKSLFVIHKLCRNISSEYAKCKISWITHLHFHDKYPIVSRETGLRPNAQLFLNQIFAGGFRKGRSAKGLLLKVTEKWRLTVDSGLTVGVVFIDFQKAFDTVSHDILAFKLQALEIASNTFELIMTYLNNRHQYTELNGQKSETKAVIWSATRIPTRTQTLWCSGKQHA